MLPDRFATNVRSATLLGVIGAGGRGQVLFESISGFYYSHSTAILIAVVITVMPTDLDPQIPRNFDT